MMTRRGFLNTAAAGVASIHAASLGTESEKLEYLTSPDRYRTFDREKPPVHRLPPEKRREAGLDRETWTLEVLADPQSNAVVERPLLKAAGTALTWEGLMGLAATEAVRFLHVTCCTNMNEPLGVGLWEGVPLRKVIWLARPAANVRRVFYDGYHNDEEKQRFQSSLALSRVLEDPPGELPVILAYKFNGDWLSSRMGGPVRMFVPGQYGNKSVKWLRSVVLTNEFKANDTYATWNNDTESPLKTFARFIDPPASAQAVQSVSIVGFAQVGMAGLAKVQYALAAAGEAPADDPNLERLPWQDARILPPPRDWGGGLPGGTLPPIPLQFDPATGAPRAWPLRGAIAHWTAVLADVRPGKYDLRCRSIDENGVAQPMPRPLPKTGSNAIQRVPFAVT
jgi:DMSO/TMAO reductase YedYZ molybdopterin-dependent catalytic subunit